MYRSHLAAGLPDPSCLILSVLRFAACSFAGSESIPHSTLQKRQSRPSSKARWTMMISRPRSSASRRSRSCFRCNTLFPFLTHLLLARVDLDWPEPRPVCCHGQPGRMKPSAAPFAESIRGAQKTAHRVRGATQATRGARRRARQVGLCRQVLPALQAGRVPGA